MAVHQPPCLTDRQAMDPPLNPTHHGIPYTPVSPPTHTPSQDAPRKLAQATSCGSPRGTPHVWYSLPRPGAPAPWDAGCPAALHTHAVSHTSVKSPAPP